ncbi:MAG: citrate lyase holo-[acyl-carrier protein] synthase [Lachnospiraceae bacterium]|jgi:holo-ACP synthase/triphosphoribosyl-dephospho-CoA synthase|nr:citrate lyase holo-[acyl-carrier protein] synthase [Lachnospiraceae bacterium]
MRFEQILDGTAVSLPEILFARSERAARQRELLALGDGSCCLISFSLNIAGAVKSFPLALAAFDEGLREIRGRIPADVLLHFEESRKRTGPQAFFLLRKGPEAVKRSMTALEESHPLGRLFDIDVLGSDGLSLSRKQFGLPPRACLVCQKEAKGCARSQAHSMEVVLWCTARLLDDFFCGRAADAAASCAVRALLYEVSATPKPGLVDRNNSGSHRDMDFFTFLDSSAALIPWFREFYCLGWEYAQETEEQLFDRLRHAGLSAERDMLSATGGVNTHKGLIFSFAILCGALGKLHASLGTPSAAGEVIRVCQGLGFFAWSGLTHQTDPGIAGTALLTPGQQLYALYGIPGARGEAAAGFPSALRVGLPALKAWLSRGYSLNDSAAFTLLTLLGEVDDTNMLHRGGRELAAQSKEEARRLLKVAAEGEDLKEKLTALDDAYIRRNLSPGGCADLLAVSLMLYFLEDCGLIVPG